MKKLLIKDKKTRQNLFKKKKLHFILFVISSNSNFLTSIQWNARKKLEKLTNNKSVTTLSNRCQKTINKKRFNKLTYYSRNIFLKQIRFGKIHGVRKIS